MVETSRSTQYRKILEPAEGKLVRALIGGNARSTAKAILSIGTIKEAVIQQLLGILNMECSTLCHKKPTQLSLFRKNPTEKLYEFEWNDLVPELEKHAPILLRIFSCLVTRNDGRNKTKKGTAHQPGICPAVAVILKERNREMCGLQSLISLLMYSSHCEKQVTA